MKDTPDNKDIVKICGMNVAPVAWFLKSTHSNNFQELFEKVTVYKELQCVAAANKLNKTSINAGTNYILRENMKEPNDNKSRDGHKETNKPHQQWHDLDNYTLTLITLKDGLM